MTWRMMMRKKQTEVIKIDGCWEKIVICCIRYTVNFFYHDFVCVYMIRICIL